MRRKEDDETYRRELRRTEHYLSSTPGSPTVRQSGVPRPLLLCTLSVQWSVIRSRVGVPVVGSVEKKGDGNGSDVRVTSHGRRVEGEEGDDRGCTSSLGLGASHSLPFRLREVRTSEKDPTRGPPLTPHTHTGGHTLTCVSVQVETKDHPRISVYDEPYVNLG